MRHVEFEAPLGYLGVDVYQEVSYKHLWPRTEGWTTDTDLEVFVIEAVTEALGKIRFQNLDVKREEDRPIS